jgi:3-isopropylmalate/(R)-2-methylmalate dehydratase large subunit
MRVAVNGTLGVGVTAKDLILGVIQEIGAAGGAGYGIEFVGRAVRNLTQEGRMTICNMAIEAGARFGLIAPDERTFAYLRGRAMTPKSDHWTRAVAYAQSVASDVGARFAKDIAIDAREIAPMVTWGTNPAMALPITARVPDPERQGDPARVRMYRRALSYMGLEPGMPLREVEISRVFVGSCTNGRIEDLRAASKIAAGRRVADHVSAMIVPGSGLVKKEAEAEGLDEIFTAAGFEWRNPGCSMCIGMNGDLLMPGERCASTSNRNFEGRQGMGGRTHLMSPSMAAAAAITGRLSDVREFG